MTDVQPTVTVVGAGPAGLAAACAAADNGARVLLIDANPYPGGELVSGLPVDGCLNAKGQWLVGGPARRLFDGCDRRGGYIGPLFDWRLNWGVCLDPVAMRLAIADQLRRPGISLALGAVVSAVRPENGRAAELEVTSRQGKSVLRPGLVIDATGDGSIAAAAGASFEKGGRNGELQPVSLTFRLANVAFAPLMDFIRDHPEELMLAESPVIDVPPSECARNLYEQGRPFVPLAASGTLLGSGIGAGEIAPCTAVFMWPTSEPRREVGLNVTRLAGVDATDNGQWSNALPVLAEQVEMASEFMRRRVPGFSRAVLSDTAYAVGVRETRRIRGDLVLTDEAVMNACKTEDGVARGTHHIDLHGAGTDQQRIPVKGGGSYDIPFGCLVPRGLTNVLVAGRCLSSERAANGSARVMGTCLAMGQAAGTAAAMVENARMNDVRELSVDALRGRLREQGAVIDGTD
jgi:hypothetical protein